MTQSRSEKPRSQTWYKSWSLATALAVSVGLAMLAGLVPSAANDDVRLCPDSPSPLDNVSGTSIEMNSRPGRETIRARRGRCVLHLEVYGELATAETVDGVPRLASGTSVEIEERYRGARRRLEIRGGADGNDYVWYEDGRRRPFDAVGQAWLAAILPELYRTTGLAAEQRAAAIFTRGGSAGVLAEIDLIRGDAVQRRYLQALLDEPRLPASEVPAVVRAAAKNLGSDHHLAELLIGNVERLAADATARKAYVEAGRAIGSDHHLRRALVALVDLVPGIAAGGDETLDAVLRVATSIGSDHHLAELLIRIVETRSSAAPLPSSFFAAADDVGSDHYLSQVLGRVVARGTAGDLEPLLDTARGIGSDHHLAELLIDLLRHHRLSPELEPAFARTARGIGSSHHSERVASARQSSGD